MATGTFGNVDRRAVGLGQSGMLQFLATFATSHRADAHAAFIAYIGRHFDAPPKEHFELDVEPAKRSQV